MSGTREHQTSVEDTLKDFWATRPRRPRRGRKLAGVAAGVANRYGIDPTVVRVAFVVATFYGGAGIPFYILGWLLLPEQDDEAAPFEAMVNRKRSSTSSAFTVLLCLALIPAFWLLLDGNDQFAGVVGLVIVAGTLFLLHKTRGHIGRTATPAPQPAPQQESTGSTPAPPPEPAAATTTPLPVEEEPVRPPAWDPLGAAPFAWNLPEPSPQAPEPPPAPRKRSKIGLMTAGIALIVAGGLATATLMPGAPSWLNPAHIIGILLAVLGLGMVGGSFVRGGRGLIGLAVPLSMIGIGLTVISPDAWHGAGDLSARPTTVAEVQDRYQRSAGSVTLDLTALPSSGMVGTMVRTDAGEAVVIVPATADVDVTCEVAAGEASCLGRQGGPGSELSFDDLGSDGEGGLKINLHAKVGAGHVEVRRG